MNYKAIIAVETTIIALLLLTIADAETMRARHNRYFKASRELFKSLDSTISISDIADSDIYEEYIINTKILLSPKH